MRCLAARLALASILLAGPVMAQADRSAGDHLYWYDSGGVAAGPVDASEIERLVIAGQIDARTLLWMEGMADWRPAASFETLAGAFAASDDVQPSFGEGGPLTLARFFSPLSPTDTLSYEVIGEQEVVLSRSGTGSEAWLFLGRDTPPAGERSISVTVEILEAEEIPGRLVGAGIIYAYRDMEEPFLAAVVSAQDGGVVQMVENVVGGGVAINQTLGNDDTRVGQPVRLTLRETSGSLEVTFGASSLSTMSDLTRAGAAGEGRLGFIFYGDGRYRLRDLEISG